MKDMKDKTRCYLLKELDCLTSEVRRCTVLLEHKRVAMQQCDAWLAASASSAELHSSRLFTVNFLYWLDEK